MPQLDVRTYRHVGPMRWMAQGYLIASEAEHNLLLGLLEQQALQSTVPDDAAVAVAFYGDSVAGVALSAPAPGRLLVLSSMTDEVGEAMADALAALPIAVPSVKGPPSATAAFANRWSGLKHQRAIPGVRERILSARTLQLPHAAPGEALIASSEHLELLGEWCDAFGQEISARQPMSRERVRALVDSQAFYLWQTPEGRVSSMSAKVRDSSNGATISLVYTPPASRRRGYAANCVASLCKHLFAAGKGFCCLYADFDNPTSNGIYTRLGFEEVATTCEFLFATDAA